MVAPEERYLARDAGDLIQVDYHPLLPLLQPLEGKKDGAGLMYRELGTNRASPVPQRYFWR
jgi:CO/xanthine dehydrogenase Mo-binding subunit